MLLYVGPFGLSWIECPFVPPIVLPAIPSNERVQPVTDAVPVPVTATPVATLGPLPPMYEPKSTSEPSALSFNRNPLLSKLWLDPGAWLYGNPPGLTGRFVACVSPATYAFPPLSTATLFPNVVKLPPRKVDTRVPFPCC